MAMQDELLTGSTARPDLLCFDDPAIAAPLSAAVLSQDPSIQRWLAADESHAATVLEELLSAHESLIRAIVSYQLRHQTLHLDADDICGEARLRLLTRLQALRVNPSAVAIHNFRSYVAVTAYRACYESLRRQYPQRHSLKHKLRVLLRERAEFTAWTTSAGEWVCGLAVWPRKTPLTNEAARRAQLSKPAPDTGGKDLGTMLRFVLQQVGQPLALEFIVTLLAEWLEIKDQPPANVNDFDEDECSLLDPQPNAAQSFDQRIYLTALWQEVAQLTPSHRAALLFNLRDGQGGNAAELWLFTGVATFGQLAEALGLSEKELAECWNDLPHDDQKIAARLALTRQQVINLRKVARARLARQMRARGF